MGTNKDRFNWVFQSRKKLHDAYEVYICARNSDNGLVNNDVKIKFIELITEMDGQLDMLRNAYNKCEK